jgi:hypothetical protein
MLDKYQVGQAVCAGLVLAAVVVLASAIVAPVEAGTITVNTLAKGTEPSQIVLLQRGVVVAEGKTYPDGSSPQFVVPSGETVVRLVNGNANQPEERVVRSVPTGHEVVTFVGQAQVSPSGQGVPLPTPEPEQTPEIHENNGQGTVGNSTAASASGKDEKEEKPEKPKGGKK